MNSARSDETAIKKIWKILSTNGTMDKMRKDLHEDPKFKEWQETFNKDIQRIIESDDTKSYENIFTELGGLEMPNSTDCSDKLEDLLKQVVDQKLYAIVYVVLWLTYQAALTFGRRKKLQLINRRHITG